MKAIIEGKRYDTATATALAYLPGTDYRSDFRYHETQVYRTPRGRYFLAGWGNAASLWAKASGSNTWGPGSGIRALTDDEARDYLERCGDAGMAAIERYFAVEEA